MTKFLIARVSDENDGDLIMTVELSPEFIARVQKYVDAVERIEGPGFYQASFWEAVRCFEAIGGGDADAEVEDVEEDFQVIDAIPEGLTSANTSAGLLHVKRRNDCYWTFYRKHSQHRLGSFNVDLVSLLTEHGLLSATSTESREG